MKKTFFTLFTSILMSLIGVTAMFAQASLNSPGSMPTLTVANVSTNPCSQGPIDGCWKQSANAAPGQQVAVHVYYKNTGNQDSTGTTLSIKPQSSGPGSSVTFTGGVASLSAPRSVGSASVYFSTTAKVTYIPGSARWYPSSSSGGQSVNESGLFGSTGFNIGTVAPGQQGVLVANFIVEGGGTQPPQGNCSINNFTVNGSSSVTINKGQSANLNWSTTGCEYVTVTNFSGNMSPTGSGTIAPSQNATYTLTAHPSGGTRTVTVTVQGTQPPQGNCSINNFTVNGSSSVTINKGQSANLNWSTTGCEYVTVTNFSGNMSPTGSGTIAPPSTRSYTLTAYPNGGTRSVTVNVNNVQPPVDNCRINDFTVNGSSSVTINKGQSANLNWSTTGCEYVTVTNFSGNMSPTGSGTVAPTSSRSYTLTAYPNGGTRTVTVNVNNTQPPADDCRIDDFTVDGRTSITLREGNTARLNWSTTGCDYVTVTGFSGNMSANGSGTVSPNSTRTYTLRAYPDGGTRTVTVNVNKQVNEYCEIVEFRANRTSIERGQVATLSWSVDGADTVHLTPGYRNRASNGSVSVSPSTTTTYTLAASGSNCSDSRSITIHVQDRGNEQPQAITTIATITGPTTAQLNGIAVPNTMTIASSTWFEWGSTRSLGYQTGSRHISAGNNNVPHGDSISGLSAGTTYYYRIVVQNSNGTAYGDIVSFRTQNQTTIVQRPPVSQPTRVIVQTINDNVIAQSSPSLLELQVASAYDHMCVGGEMEYVVTYKNISSVTLEDTVLRVALPKELTFTGANRGSYDSLDRIVTLGIGRLAPGEQSSVTIRARFNENAIRGNLAVMTATVVYTNPVTRAQEDAIAYSLVTVSEECPLVLGANVYGFGSFLPDTLLEWLLLILVILALILLGRNLYKKREEEKRA